MQLQREEGPCFSVCLITEGVTKRAKNTNAILCQDIISWKNFTILKAKRRQRIEYQKHYLWLQQNELMLSVCELLSFLTLSGFSLEMRLISSMDFIFQMFYCEYRTGAFLFSDWSEISDTHSKTWLFWCPLPLCSYINIDNRLCDLGSTHVKRGRPTLTLPLSKIIYIRGDRVNH